MAHAIDDLKMVHEEEMKNKILLAADKLADTARSVVCE